MKYLAGFMAKISANPGTYETPPGAWDGARENLGISPEPTPTKPTKRLPGVGSVGFVVVGSLENQ